MKSMINISDFNEIMSGIKAMKADLVTVYNNLLIGVDKTMSNMKVYSMSKIIPVPVFTIITKELSSKFFSNIIDTNIIIDMDENKIYCPNNKSYADETNQMITSIYNNQILSIYQRVCSNINNSITVRFFGDITDDENFQIIKNMKSSDGAILYAPKEDNMYGMYLYSGSIPANKNDKIDLEIYDSGDTFIAKFVVYKKKLNPVSVYFRFIKMTKG